MFEVRLSKESFKFSSAHFTVFDSSRAERLHGHNYYIEAELHFSELDPQTAMTLDFHELKATMQKLCTELDEFVLLPSESSFVSVEKDDESVRVDFAEKRYVFPLVDVKLLALPNITCEGLADHLACKLYEEWKPLKSLQLFKIFVEETRGQRVSVQRKMSKR